MNKIETSMLQALSNFYLYVYYIDIRTNTIQNIKNGAAPIYHDAANLRTWFLTHMTDSSCRLELESFTNSSTLEKRLCHQSMIYQDYKNVSGSWIRMAFLPAAYSVSGELTHVFLLGQNIDDSHHKMEQQKRELAKLNEQLQTENNEVNAQLETVMSGISGGYVINYDTPGYPFAHVSLAAAKNQGYDTVDEFLLANYNSGLHNIYEDDREAFLQSFHAQLAVGNTYSSKYRVVCRDGSLKWIMDSGRRNTDKDGHTIFCSLLLDVTGHERINQMYKSERRCYREALLHDCEYVFTIDLTTETIESGDTTRTDALAIPFQNYKFPLKLNQHLESVWNDFEFIEPYPDSADILSHEKILEDFKHGIRNREIEYYDKLRDMYLRITILLSEREEDHHIIGILIGRDITSQIREQEQARKLLEEKNAALEKACLEAKLANSAKTDFLARMSHDIRTPLNAILGLLEISGRCQDDPVKVESYRKKAILSANHLLSLLNDVLDMSKLENETIVLSEEPFNMNELLAQTRQIMDSEIFEKGLTRSHPEAICLEHPDVLGSPVHVRQILTNILSNAIKYNVPDGTISITAEETFLDSDFVHFQFIIADSGIGMSDDFLSHIFEPFTRESDVLQTNISGAGLGMSIVKKLIDKMNGTIQVQSEKNKGTVFIITIPFRRSKCPVSSVRSDTAVSAGLSGIRILLVEDNELNREVAEYLLSDEGAKVEIAINGKDAVDKFSGSHPGYYDIILLDIMMPVLDGYGTAYTIRHLEREDAATIPIIALTANAFSDDIERCKSYGMNDHLAKPLNITEVVTLIRRYIQ